MSKSKRRPIISTRRKRRAAAAKKGWVTRRRNARRRVRKPRRRRVARPLPRRRRAIVVRRRRKVRGRPRARVPRAVRDRRRAANRSAGRLKATARPAGVFSRAARPRRRRRELTTVAIGAAGADPLNVQLTAKFRLPTGESPSKKMVLDAYKFRIANGFDLPGVTTTIVRWRNPARKTADKRAWRQGDQDAAWNTLKNAISAWLEHQIDDEDPERCGAKTYRFSPGELRQCERVLNHTGRHVVTIAGVRHEWK